MMELQVTELGVERRCRKCREWWPLDAEFYHRRPGGYEADCRACRGKGLFSGKLDNERVYAMLRAGRKVPEIADELGASHGAIYKRQRAYRERAA